MSTEVSVLQAAFYGVVQGLTEFLPISSTAHLRITQAWLNPDVDQPGFTAFTAVIQLGTMAAVVLFFWRELLHVSMAWLRGLVDSRVRGSLEYRMGWYLILATIPVGVFGFLFRRQIETGARNLWLIASALIVLALVLLVAERRGTQTRTEEDLTTKDALVVGVAQSLALIPGVSRSGATITAGRWRGFNRDAAARLSFLMSLPITGGAVTYEVVDMFREGGIPPGFGGALIVGILASGVMGWVAVWGTLQLVRTRTFTPFVIYRVVVGVGVVLLAASGLR